MLQTLDVSDSAPWKQRFRAPVVLWTQLAKTAPARGLAASNQSGVFQLYTWDVPSGKLTQLTKKPEGQVFGGFSPDGRYAYYLDDKVGNEIGHLVRVPFEGGPPQDITPDMPPYSVAGVGISLACNKLGLTVVGREGFQVYMMDNSGAATGAPNLVFQSKALATGPLLSHDGEIAIMMSAERAGKPQFSLLAFNSASGQRIAELWDGPDTSIEASLFSPLPGDFRVLAVTDCTKVKRPLLWNPHTGERIDLPLGDLEGDVEPMDWSMDGERLLLRQTSRATHQLYVYQLKNGKMDRLKHPGGTYSFAYFGAPGEIFVQWQDSTHPTRLIALDEATGVQTRTVLAAGALPASRPWRSVKFASADGQEIQGWLAVPEGEGPFPTILETHGGPQFVETELFRAGSQAWLDHGLAYLTINYRGSVSFGKEFEQKIWRDLGHWEVEDMVAARAWLIDNRIAKPDEILLTGWSYGGYLTLQALGKYPELWAGGMAGIAIADWAVQYEDSAPLLREYEASLFGGAPQELPERYAASSPITYAENVKAPVLIIQGRNDSRTPARPVELYEQKMKAHGKQIEVEWFKSGHLGSFAEIELGIKHQERMLRFAYRVLG